ncbi:DNA repair protein RecO [Desulfolithobacter sp.]
MKERRTSGIVLQIRDHGESDKLVTFYSPDLGRATGIAKGAKRSKRRFVNKLEPFTRLSILYRPPRSSSLVFLAGAELDNAYLSLRRQYSRFVAATLIAELILCFTREEDGDPATFRLLAWALGALDRGQPPLQTATLFHLRLLGIAGYRPVLDRCSICNREVSPDVIFSLPPSSGLLICHTCRNEPATSNFTLSTQTLKFLHNAQVLDLDRLDRLRMSHQATLESLNILYRYTQHLLQQDIHSYRFLNIERKKKSFFLKKECDDH